MTVSAKVEAVVRAKHRVKLDSSRERSSVEARMKIVHC